MRRAHRRRASAALLWEFKLFLGIPLLHRAPLVRLPQPPRPDERTVLSSDSSDKEPQPWEQPRRVVEVVDLAQSFDELPDLVPMFQTDYQLPEAQLLEACVLLEHLLEPQEEPVEEP